MKTNAETVTIPKAEYDNLCNNITVLTAKVEWLMEQFRLAQHRRFGASSEKSVQTDHEQRRPQPAGKGAFSEETYITNSKRKVK